MSESINVIDLGKRGYKEVWDIQKNLHQQRVKNEIPDTLILVEHNPVVTIGKSGKDTNIKVPIDFLRQRGIDFYRIERGGDVTFHGPGQLVGYLIFDIKKGLAGIKPFIGKIEDAIIKTLVQFSIDAFKREKMIGVWTGNGKICSIGVAVKNWVSFHGFALNVSNDLEFFNLINPCGFADIKMTSMNEVLGREISVSEVKQKIVRNFAEVFEKKVVSLF